MSILLCLAPLSSNLSRDGPTLPKELSRYVFPVPSELVPGHTAFEERGAGQVVTVFSLLDNNQISVCFNNLQSNKDRDMDHSHISIKLLYPNIL